MLGTHSELHRGQMSHICDISPLRVKFFLVNCIFYTRTLSFECVVFYLGINNFPDVLKGLSTGAKEVGITKVDRARTNF